MTRSPWKHRVVSLENCAEPVFPDPVTEDANLYAGVNMTFSPEIETAGFAYSIEDAAAREDGSLMALVRYVPPLTGEDTLLGSHDVTLCLKDLHWNCELAAYGYAAGR